MSIHIDVKDIDIGNVALDNGDAIIVLILRKGKKEPEQLFKWTVMDDNPAYKMTIVDR
jgi:hypothetical protein